MAKKIRFDLDMAVKGKEVVQSTISDVEELKKRTREIPEDLKKLNESLRGTSRFGDIFAKITESGKPMQRQLREIQKLLSEMKFEGLDNTEEFQAMTQYAGNMADAIADARANVNYFASDTRKLDTAVGMFQGVAGALSVAQGALALFDEDNKAFEQTMKKVQGTLALVNGVQAISNTLNRDSALVMGVKNLQTKLATMWSKAHGGAVLAEAAATKGATVATRALNAVLKANPVGLVITAITTLIGLFTLFSGKTEEATNELGKLEDGSNDLNTALGRQMEAQEEAGKSAGELTSKYEVLRMKYLACRSDMEVTQFIRNNAEGFKSLGLNINNAADAMETFVRKAPQVRAALLQISVAKGMQKAMEDYTAQWATDQAKNPITLPSVGQGMRYKMSRTMSGYNKPSWMEEAGITDDMITNWEGSSQTAELNLQGLGRARDYVATQRAQQERARQNEFNKVTHQLMDSWMEAEAKAEEMASAAGINFSNGEFVGNTPSAKTPNARTPKTVAPKTAALKSQSAKTVKETVKKELTELQRLEQQRDEIARKLSNPALVEGERDNLRKQQSEIESKIDFLRTWTNERKYVLDLPDKAVMVDFDGAFDVNKENFDKQVENALTGIDLTQSRPFELRERFSGQQWSQIENQRNVSSSASSVMDDVRDMLDMGAIGTEKAQELADAINAYLQVNGLEPIPVSFELEKSMKDLEKLRDSFSPMSDLAKGAGEAFKAFGEDTAASIAQVGAALFDGIGKIISAVIANQALALSEGVAGASSLPFPANIGAIATITGVILSTFAQIMSIAGSFATGGIVGGTSVSGDKLLARVNSGEMILNKNQQTRLFGMLNGLTPPSFRTPSLPNLDGLRANSGGTMDFRISGRNLVGVLANETRISRKSGRRTMIKI